MAGVYVIRWLLMRGEGGRGADEEHDVSGYRRVEDWLLRRSGVDGGDSEGKRLQGKWIGSCAR